MSSPLHDTIKLVIYIVVIIIINLLFIHTSHAETVKTWAFKLATLDGKAFIDSRHIAQPILVNFWSKDCPPCVHELPRLQKFAQQNPQWQVILINTDQSARQAHFFLQQHKIDLTSVKSGLNAIALMRQAGNRIGGLPYSVALNSGKTGQVCAYHLGEMFEQHLNQVKGKC